MGRSVPALTDVQFRCGGRRHAILGENGAGKSTLMKLLWCYSGADRGAYSANGAPRSFALRADAAREGIVCMFQELSLMPHLSVGDNRAGSAHGALWPSRAPPTLGRAGPRQRRGVSPFGANLRALLLPSARWWRSPDRAPKLLILDEATSALTSELVERVFGVVRGTLGRGAAIRLHLPSPWRWRRLRPVSVFRNGRHVVKTFAGARSSDAISSA